MKNLTIILGSSSKYRRQVLLEMGYEFDVMAPNIDEKAIRHKNPRELVLAIARAKADRLLEEVQEPAILITSDQVVVCNGQIREKPESKEQAQEFLHSYEQYPAETVSGVVVTHTESGKQVEGVDVAKMHFAPIPDKIIEQLIGEGDIMYCAGGFIGEHELLQPYVASLQGDISSIMGLPKKLTKRLIEEVVDSLRS